MTLIDTMVGSALLLIVFVGVAGVFQLSVDVVTNNKSRAGAIALAAERMEYVRSLSYSSIGTSGGIPSGALAQSETITLNNTDYTRRTTILYGDDPYDGLAGADTYPSESPTPLDYKSVRVDVSWTSRIGERHITLVTRIEPRNGTEVSCTAPCGAISVYVVNAASQPVQNARVDIINSTVNPTVSLTTYTNTDGVASLLGAPVGSGYSIVITKTGYSSDQTWGSSGQNPSPSPPHVSVANNQTTSMTFAIDYLASKTVVTRSQATGGGLAAVPFTLRGNKYIGSNPTVYKFEEVLGNGGTGTTTLANMEWDTYAISIDPSTGYDIASSCDAPQPQYLAPASSQTTVLYLAAHTSDSLLVDVRTNTGVLVPGATVRLEKNPSIDTTLTSDLCGQAFFSSLSNGGNYSLTISAAGYTQKTFTNVNVNGTSVFSAPFD